MRASSQWLKSHGNGAVLVHVSLPFITFKLLLIADQTYLMAHTNTIPFAYTVTLLFFFVLNRVVIIFIIIKIFFYVCWYRSRQRQLAAYLSNPRNAQIVIVGGRAYLHQMCERQSVSADTPNPTTDTKLWSTSQKKTKQVGGSSAVQSVAALLKWICAKTQILRYAHD